MLWHRPFCVRPPWTCSPPTRWSRRRGSRKSALHRHTCPGRSRNRSRRRHLQRRYFPRRSPRHRRCPPGSSAGSSRRWRRGGLRRLAIHLASVVPRSWNRRHMLLAGAAVIALGAAGIGFCMWPGTPVATAPQQAGAAGVGPMPLAPSATLARVPTTPAYPSEIRGAAPGSAIAAVVGIARRGRGEYARRRRIEGGRAVATSRRPAMSRASPAPIANCPVPPRWLSPLLRRWRWGCPRQPENHRRRAAQPRPSLLFPLAFPLPHPSRLLRREPICRLTRSRPRAYCSRGR